MLRRWILIAVAVVGAGFASAAQENDIVRQMYDVEEVIPEVVDGQLTLIVRGLLPDGCEGETIAQTQRSGSALFIDLYRQFEAEPVCSLGVQPFEVVVDGSELLTLDADATLPNVLVVNARVYRVNLPQIEPMPSATLIAPTLSELSRGFLDVETITALTNVDGALALRVQGMGSDGCVTPIVRAIPDWQTPREVLIEAFNAIDPAAMCLQALTPFDVTIPANVQIGDFDLFRLYGLPFELDPEMDAAPQTFVVQTLAVDTVDAEVRATYPDQLVVVTASGVIDGCSQTPGLFLRQIVEQTVQLQAARIVPEMQACTMIARPLMLSVSLPTRLLPTGTVVIVVNDASPITVELQ
ncbi:hypothetical protein VZO05_11815 [Aggregatilineales bacterium SYSU G02658]